LKDRLERAGNAFSKLDNLFADFGKSDSEDEMDKLVDEDDGFYE
jgi:hypothetical protein